MAITKEDKDGCTILRIDGPMTVYEAASLRDALIECLDACNRLSLDMKDVTECDTAGIQLLCSARITADAEGKQLVLNGISEAVNLALETSGISTDRIFHP